MNMLQWLYLVNTCGEASIVITNLLDEYLLCYKVKQRHLPVKVTSWLVVYFQSQIPPYINPVSVLDFVDFRLLHERNLEATYCM